MKWFKRKNPGKVWISPEHYDELTRAAEVAEHARAKAVLDARHFQRELARVNTELFSLKEAGTADLVARHRALEGQASVWRSHPDATLALAGQVIGNILDGKS